MKHRIFGIGLSKTGTSSLSAYLSSIKIKSTHDDFGFFKAKTIDDVKVVASGESFIGALCPVWMLLFEKYPTAKYILTVREKETWLKSLKRHLEGGNGNKSYRLKAFNVETFDEKICGDLHDIYDSEVIKFFKDKDNLLVIDLIKGDSRVNAKRINEFLGLTYDNQKIPHKNKGKQ